MICFGQAQSSRCAAFLATFLNPVFFSTLYCPIFQPAWLWSLILLAIIPSPNIRSTGRYPKSVHTQKWSRGPLQQEIFQLRCSSHQYHFVKLYSVCRQSEYWKFLCLSLETMSNSVGEHTNADITTESSCLKHLYYIHIYLYNWRSVSTSYSLYEVHIILIYTWNRL